MPKLISTTRYRFEATELCDDGETIHVTDMMEVTNPFCNTDSMFTATVNLFIMQALAQEKKVEMLKL